MNESLHDWLLLSLTLEWASGELVIALRDVASQPRMLVAKEAQLLVAPRVQPWGESDSILAHQIQRDGKAVTLQLEMQSGDTLTIKARSVALY